MKRLIREVAPNAFEKCFEDRSVLNWAESVQADIVRAAMYLTELTAIKLKVCPCGSAMLLHQAGLWHKLRQVPGAAAIRSSHGKPGQRPAGRHPGA